MKRILFISVFLVAAAVSAYLWRNRGETAPAASRYVTVQVEKGTLRSEITCTGTLRPLVEVLVGSQVSGTVKEVYVDFESEVSTGQLLALIDPALFEAKLIQAQADVKAAIADLAQSRLDMEEELRDLKRQEALFKGNSISESQFDTAKTEADLAAAQVAVKQARVAQAEAKAKEADLQLKYTRIVSPVNGIVIDRSVDPGQTVAASFQAPDMFKIAEDLSRMQVHTNVDEADIGEVKKGQTAVFTVPAFPDRVFNASVARIRNEPTVEQNVVTYNVELRVDNDDLKLRPGMTTYVKILVNEVPNALMVPDQALRFIPSRKRNTPSRNPTAVDKTNRVWRLESNGEPAAVEVQIGATGTEKSQVISDNLKPGDTIVVEEVIPGRKKKSFRGLRLRL